MVSFIDGENHRQVACHGQTISHNVVSSTPGHDRNLNSQTLVVIYTDCTGSCTIGTTTSPIAAKKITDMLPFVMREKPRDKFDQSYTIMITY